MTELHCLIIRSKSLNGECFRPTSLSPNIGLLASWVRKMVSSEPT